MFTVTHLGKYYPPARGGIESVTHALATGSARAGFRTQVLCFSHAQRPEYAEEGVSITSVPVTTVRASQPFSWQYFRQAVRAARASAFVHLHAPNFLAALAVLFMPRSARLVVHWHSDVVAKGFLYFLVRPLEWMMLNRCDAIICTSERYAASSHALKAFRHKIRAIPIGIADPQKRSSTADYRVPPNVSAFLRGRRFVLSVGRLVPYKGFECLIDAAPLLPQDCAVVIVGDGPLRHGLEQRVRSRRAADRVFIAGAVGEDELEALYREAAVFCLSSSHRAEAFGVVLIEAMARGLPVIATEIAGSGVPWVNRHGTSGLNVPVHSPSDLATACSAVLNDAAAAARYAKGARNEYLRRFTLEQSVSAVLDLYAELSQVSLGLTLGAKL